MSMQSIWLRARDGALYQNPVFIFKQGFICFDEEDPPELVIWPGLFGLVEDAIVANLLVLALGRSYKRDSICRGGESMRVVPHSDPWEFRPAASFSFEIFNRIPIPHKHDGTERYPRNCNGKVYDWPPHILDASELREDTL